MCDTGKISIIPPTATFKTIKVQSDEVLVVKIDTQRYTLEQASEIYQDIVKQLPDDIRCIGVPTGIEVEPTLIKDPIKCLEELL